LQFDFTAQDGKVTLRQMRTYGGAVGINADGVADLNADTLDVRGTLVPAYTLNNILGNIPIIGSLLQVGEGQRLFAGSFSVSGSVNDPQVSVNPLTALAPGFLRNLFLPGPPSADGKSAPPGDGNSGAAKTPK